MPEISLTVNGHMALELAIQSFDFPEGAEVITTPFTFISTTHAIVRNKLQPVFCDVKEDDGTIDETKIEDLITEKTVAILLVHVYGNVCNVEAIQEIADKYNLKVIYDAAHAVGEKYLGKGIGNYGDVSIFSFHATKVFNTIEGGAVVCKNHERYERVRGNDIYTRKYFYPLTADQACFKNKYKNKSLDVARKLAQQSMVLPLFEELNANNQSKILELLKIK